MNLFRRNIICQNELAANIFILFVALAVGLIISSGLFLPHQILMLAGLFVLLIILFNKPGVLALIIIVLMFIPLFLGSIFKVKFQWLVEPLIIILFLCNILRKIVYKHENYALSRKNPFLIPVTLYFAVVFLNYIRNPVPATSFLALPSEMGGFRHYYESFLLMLLFFTFADLVVSESNFAERGINVLFWILTITTIVGLLTLFVEPIQSLITQLQHGGIFNTRAMATGVWAKDIDVRSGAFHSLLLGSVTPLGILLLVSGAVRMKKICKIILFLMFAFGLIFSGIRSFFFGTIAALIFLTFQQRNRQLFSLMIIGAILVYIFYYYYSPLLLSQQFQRLFWLKGGFYEIAPSRGPLFSAYWESFKKHPFLGVGFGTTAVGRARLASYEYYLLTNLRYGGHGFFLGTLYTKGLAALIPFLWILGVGIYSAFKLSKVKENNTGSIAIFCFLFLVYCIIPFSVGGIETYNLLFLIVGILSGLHMKYRSRKRGMLA